MFSQGISSTNFLASLIDQLFAGNIVVFIMGFLFTIGLYHFLLYFQHKDKSYLYYSLYTTLIFIYLLPKPPPYFLSGLVYQIKPFLYFVYIPIQWAIYTVYLLFFQEYIGLKIASEKWNSILNIIIVTNVLLLILISAIAYIFQIDSLLSNVFYFVIAPTFLLVGIVFMIVISKFETNLKYYIIIGSSLYLFFASFSFYMVLNEIHSSLFPFFIAIVLENVFFALGLGAKHKKILNDKNIAQQQVIAGQKQNLILQQNIQIKLDKEVALKTKEILALTEANKKEQKRKLALEYSKNTLDLRMRALQTQMNPHFLFNSLNSIKHFIIKNKKKEASYFLSKLSKLLRLILDNSRLQEITLQEELDIMKLYLEVENIRLKKEIEFDVTLDNIVEPCRIRIPPLVLQPFIENAIWHGLVLKQGVKRISIRIEKEPSFIQLTIIDNGIGRKTALKNKAARLVEKESLGIDLSRERIEAYVKHLKNDFSIEFRDLQNEEPTGTKVIIRIPLQ